MEDYLTVQEASEQYGKWATTIRRAIKRGTLPAVKRGRQWFIRRSDMVDWVENPPKPGPDPKS